MRHLSTHDIELLQANRDTALAQLHRALETGNRNPALELKLKQANENLHTARNQTTLDREATTTGPSPDLRTPVV